MKLVFNSSDGLFIIMLLMHNIGPPWHFPTTNPLPETNDYIPIFNDSEWLYAEPFMVGNLPFKVFQSGDTTINGLSYFKVTFLGIDIEGIDTYPFATHSEEVRYFRESITERKVWELNHNTGQEILIFDFSLSLGDTLAETIFVLESIETITLNNIERQKFIFSEADEGQNTNPRRIIWIEGVGNTTAPLRGRAMDFDPPLSPGVICMSQGGELVYNEGANRLNLPESCSTHLTVPTKNILELDPALRLFPNPGSSFITISSEILAGKRVNWIIRDVLGREIISQNSQLFSANHHIDINQLEAGTYFLTLFNEEGQQTIRFVKQ